MKKRATNLRDLLRIRNKNQRKLFEIEGNLGTALGNNPNSGEPSILVFVERKINEKWLPEGEKIPKRLDGPDNFVVSSQCY